MPNYDPLSGIYFGAIHRNSVSPYALEDMELAATDLTFEDYKNRFRKAVEGMMEEYMRDASLSRQEVLLELAREYLDDFLSDHQIDDLPEILLEDLRGETDGPELIQAIYDALEQFAVDRYESDGDHDWEYEQDGYRLTKCLDYDIFVLGSRYYTHCCGCSPCVPEAGDLDNPNQDGRKTYCLGPDWFDEHTPCLYPIWRVDNDQLIYSPQK